MRHALYLAFVLLFAHAAHAADGPTPKLLFDATAPNAIKQLAPNGPSQPEVSFKLVDKAIEVTIAANGKSSYPGIVLTPPTPWNLLGCGHVEAKITNTGTSFLRLSLRIDDNGPWQGEPYSAEKIGLKPGQSGTVRNRAVMAGT